MQVHSSPLRAFQALELAQYVSVHQLRQFGERPLRDDAELMQPERLAGLQPSPLSCSHYFLEHMFRDQWKISCTCFDLDSQGVGIARYSITIGEYHFEFVALANAPVPGGRTARVLTGDRDMNGGLYEGTASEKQIETMRREMPKIYSGRAEPDTLIWCRSNRSTRVFDHVVEALAERRNPDPDLIAETGYLMRNVGIEGNGIYGTRNFLSYGRSHPLALPYMAQMLAGYLMREYSFDLVEHLARVKNPKAATLTPSFKRFIGIGNGSAIGLVFFVYDRPQFVGRWLEMRERLIASAAALRLAPLDPRRDALLALLRKAAVFVAEDQISQVTQENQTHVSRELNTLVDLLEAVPDLLLPVVNLLNEARKKFSQNTAEIVDACVMELLPDLRDQLLNCFLVDEELPLSPAVSVPDLKCLIEKRYGWALTMDSESDLANYFVWYRSTSNDEPRRGTRNDTSISDNMLYRIAAKVKALHADLQAFDREEGIAEFLLAHPEHRFSVQRIELLAEARFHTPQCNPCAREFIALNLVRLIMVGFYGLAKPVDFLDRNTRGILFHGAPSRGDIGSKLESGWHFPLLSSLKR